MKFVLHAKANAALQILSISHLFIIIRFIDFAKCDILPNCIKNQNNTIFPTCQILNNSNSTSFHCIEKWNNTIFIERGGDITIDCWAKFPIDFDYDGVLPIANLKLSFYKRAEVTPDLENNSFLNLTEKHSYYGIKIHIIERELVWSGNYIFHSLENPKHSIMISVFSQKNDLPIFLPLKINEKPLDAYLEEDNLVIPCRVTNFNATVKLYHDFVPLENVLYDPRKGYIRERTSEEVLEGEYECMSKWHKMLDRIKVTASKIPGESDEDDESDYDKELEETVEDELKNLTGTISFTKTDNNTFSATCKLPQENMDLETLSFTNILSKSPTYSRLQRRCLGFEHTCDKLVGMWEVESPIPEIDEIYNSGLIKCFDAKNQEVLEYFTGSDNELYFDWKDALEKNAIIKLESLDEPEQLNQNFTANKDYGFKCKFPHYVAAGGSVWWKVGFRNGSSIESIESAHIKYLKMDLEMTTIACGISLWNATDWYYSTMEVQVFEEELKSTTTEEPAEEEQTSSPDPTEAAVTIRENASSEISEVDFILAKTNGSNIKDGEEIIVEKYENITAQENGQENGAESAIGKSSLSHTSTTIIRNNTTNVLRRNVRRRKVKYVVVHTVEEKKCFIDEFDFYSATLAVRMRKLSPKQFAIAKIEIERLMMDIEFPVNHNEVDHDDNENHGSVLSTAKLVRI